MILCVCGRKTHAKGLCRICYEREYRQRPEVKERVREYLSRPEVRERERKRGKKYHQRPEVKERQRKRNKKNYKRPEVKEYMREYARRPEVKERIREYNHRPEVIEYRKEYYSRFEVKERVKEHNKRYYNKNIEKYRSHSIVKYAISIERIEKPSNCSICGVSDTVIHGHHPDYNKPLNVMWVCPSCHGMIHREIRETNNHP